MLTATSRMKSRLRPTAHPQPTVVGSISSQALHWRTGHPGGPHRPCIGGQRGVAESFEPNSTPGARTDKRPLKNSLGVDDEGEEGSEEVGERSHGWVVWQKLKMARIRRVEPEPLTEKYQSPAFGLNGRRDAWNHERKIPISRFFHCSWPYVPYMYVGLGSR